MNGEREIRSLRKREKEKASLRGRGIGDWGRECKKETMERRKKGGRKSREMGMQSLKKSKAEKVRVAWLVSMAMSA